MTDLTEFLLARIAEDEAEARGQLELRAARYPGEPDDGEPVRYMTDRGWWLQAEPNFILAECHAKRRIVGATQAYSDGSPSASCMESAVLELLALPYADHPDYDEAWRP